MRSEMGTGSVLGAGDWEVFISGLVDTTLEEIGRGGRGDQVCVLFADDEDVRVLNRDYRGIDCATNVLSFPQYRMGDGAGGWLAGDVVLARGTVMREACEMGCPVLCHVGHLVVHGVLHLYGYDHVEEKAADEMEDLERKILERVGLWPGVDDNERKGKGRAKP